MTKKNYYMPELIEKYYKGWINGPTLLEDRLDRDRFYRFVKACIRYSRRHIDTGWLRHFLKRDLAKRYSEQYRDEIIMEILILFEHIINFNKTSFPDHIFEMRNPYFVWGELRRHGCSEDETEKILVKNFGSSWRKDWSIL